MISAGTLLMEKSPLLVVPSLYMVWRSLIKVYIDLKDRSHKAMLPPTSTRIYPPLLHSIQAKQTLRDNSRSWGKKQKNSKNFTLTLEATVFLFFFKSWQFITVTSLLLNSALHYPPCKNFAQPLSLINAENPDHYLHLMAFSSVDIK